MVRSASPVEELVIGISVCRTKVMKVQIALAALVRRRFHLIALLHAALLLHVINRPPDGKGRGVGSGLLLLLLLTSGMYSYAQSLIVGPPARSYSRPMLLLRIVRFTSLHNTTAPWAQTLVTSTCTLSRAGFTPP